MADIRKSAAIFFISMRPGRIKGVGGITVQTGCSYTSLLAQSIHLREKNIAGPTGEIKRCECIVLVQRVGPAFFDEDDVCDSV